jgi:spore coat protein CotH
LKTLGSTSGDELITAIAEKTDSQYVMTGAITQLAGSFSIDAKVYDIANKRYMAFFEQSKKSDDLIEKVDRIAASINQKVFDRSTVTWEKMEQERQKLINDYKRRNPEHLMQVPQGWQPKEEIGWKVWKYLF